MLIGRTLVAERVRAVIARTRAMRWNRIISDSESEQEVGAIFVVIDNHGLMDSFRHLTRVHIGKIYTLQAGEQHCLHSHAYEHPCHMHMLYKCFKVIRARKKFYLSLGIVSSSWLVGKIW